MLKEKAILRSNQAEGEISLLDMKFQLAEKTSI